MSLSAAVKLPRPSVRTCFAAPGARDCRLGGLGRAVTVRVQRFFAGSCVECFPRQLGFLLFCPQTDGQVHLLPGERTKHHIGSARIGWLSRLDEAIAPSLCGFVAGQLVDCPVLLDEIVGSCPLCRVLQVKHQHSHIGRSNSTNTTGLAKAQRADARKFFPGLGP